MALKKMADGHQERRSAADERERTGGPEVVEVIHQVKGLDASKLAQRIQDRLGGDSRSVAELGNDLGRLEKILKEIFFEEHVAETPNDMVVSRNLEDAAAGHYTVSEPLLAYLKEMDVPRSKWEEAAEAVERLTRKFSGPVDRPRWEDRAKYSELEFLPAPEFLKRVWADQISPTGEIEKELVRRQDSALMIAVEGYIKNRQRRAIDAGAAKGLKLIARGYGGRKARKKSR